MSRPISTASFFLASLIVVSAAGCDHVGAQDARIRAPIVRVGTVGDIAQVSRAFSGVVSARVQSDLGFRVAGKVTERLVDAGQAVHRGQPLMRMDRTDFLLATASLTGVLEAARAHALQTAADEKRYRSLVSAGAVSASAYDLTKASADAAAAQLLAAEAQVGAAKNASSYSVLAADDDGTVVETLAEPGQVVAAGQTVVRLAHAGPREATVSLPETMRPQVGSTALATLYGETGPSEAARLRQLSDAADPTTRTFDARYVLEGIAARAPLGATVTIYIPVVNTTTATQIPISALFDNGKGPGVWVVVGKQPEVEWRPVKVTELGEETVTASGGLKSGDRFVTLGAHMLHQGEHVRIAAQEGTAQ
jgi:RND family efflux transporter MFP subunit